MKPEELMIGDWVEISGVPEPVVIEEVYGKGAMTNVCIAYYDEIFSIPLTPEILEKNGFKSWEHGYIWKERIGIGGQTTSASSPIEIIIYEGGHSVIMNPHEGRDFQGSIDNVHELQHALRLCGINKEIVV